MANKISPMMQHYLLTKERYKDSILFYRLGDFYEMFFDDAILCSKVLDLTLTGKDCGLEERAPMCGVPHHAAENYISRLVESGYKVAVCEQLTEPSGRGLVERDVLRIVTPGTIQENLEEKKNNFLCSVYASKGGFGITYVDITTGELNLLEVDSVRKVEDALNRIHPAEIICNSEIKYFENEMVSFKQNFLPKMYVFEDFAFGFSRSEKLAKQHFGVSSLSVFDVEGKKLGICALGALLEYLSETQKRNLLNINKIVVERDKNFMHLDMTARRNLELVENMNTKKKRGSIIWLLDKTKSALGGRLIRKFVEQPIVDADLINMRLDAVEEFSNNTILLRDVQSHLSKFADIERIVGKLSYGTISPRDCIALAGSLALLPSIKASLSRLSSSLLTKCNVDIQNLPQVESLINLAIREDSPVGTQNGGYIREGFNAELDEIRSAGSMGRKWLASLEQKEREETGIKTLKIGFNKVFGYYIEITNSYLSQVPYRYIRRQTTTGSERFITEELKSMEEKILGSEEKSLKLESKLFAEVKDFLKEYISAFQSIAGAIALVDAICSLADCATEYNFCKPKISDDITAIKITNGRHPIVENLLVGDTFVPNDTLLDCGENRTMIITGPNMAGKSTYMRQVAVIVLLAHIGSFVPASEAEISIVDRIFTRIGASDDLAFGQSTFMVEMTEVANILNNATSKSLLVLDEIGRGTSTYDGLSIAWAVMEYLSKHLKAKTLFATHYHELAELEGKIEGVKNYRVLVKESANDIIFLHKIARGSANRSFGIEVASLAGLPAELTTRAREILKLQEEANQRATDFSFDKEQISSSSVKQNVNTTEIINVLSEMDMNTITPLMAFGTLQNLVDKVKK